MYRVYVVSDGTGGTAQRALNAALLQFEGAKIDRQEDLLFILWFQINCAKKCCMRVDYKMLKQ